MEEISSQDRLSILSAYAEWVNEIAKRNDERRYAAIVTLMFRHIPGSFEQKWSVMRREAERVYSTLVRHVVRHPERKSSQSKLPIWVFAPDYPIWKRGKDGGRASLADVSVNDGLHLQGVMFLPVESRMRVTLGMHMHPMRRWYREYVRPDHPVYRIHVEPIEETLDVAADYVLKTLKGRVPDLGYVEVLPRTLSEIGNEHRSKLVPRVVTSRMDETLRFWIDGATGSEGEPQDEGRARFLLGLLEQYEQAGNAMRYLDRNRRVAWKATPSFLTHLHDLEMDAREDEEQFI